MSNYKATRDEYSGSQITETSITRVGGATDGVQAQSMKITTNAQATFLTPYREFPLAIWNDVTGTDVSVTVYGTVNAASLPLNDEIWLECQYLGNASNSLASFKSTSKSHPLATGAAVASDGSSWNTPSPLAPTGLTGLVGWWDPSVTASLNLTGSNINSVADQSGLNNTVNWGGFNKPLYHATALNGRPCFNMNVATVAGFIRTAAGFPMGTGNTLTGWAVCTLLDPGNNANASDGRVLAYSAPGVPDFNNAGSWSITRPALSHTQLQYNRNFSTYPVIPASWVGGVPHRVIWTVDATGLTTIYVDGVVANTLATIPGNWVSGGNVCIGGNGSGSNANFWDGPIGEVGIATGYHDAATVARLDAYLANKWGFPPLTPFKLTATLTSPQPQQRGYIYARVFAGKASTTYYLDPKLELSSTGGVTNGPMSNKVTRDEYAGSQITETSITRVGGAVAGTSTTPISTKITTNAQSTFLTPYRSLRLAAWNDVTGVNRTVTVCGTINSASLPLNDEIWLECQYLGNASNSLASFKSTSKSHPLAAGAAVASDGVSVWNGTSGGSGAPLDAVASVTGAWSLGRNMLTSFGAGTRYTKTGSAITALNDQSGASRHFNDGAVAARRPTEATAFPANILCADFFGTSTNVMLNVALSNFITASSGAVVVSVIVDAITTNTTISYQNDGIIADSGQYMGLYARALSGVTFYAYNYDGNEDAPSTTGAVGTAYVLMWRHHGGNQYVSVNGGTEVMVASGNTQVMTGLLHLGGNNGGSACNCKIAEVFTTSDGSQTAALAAAIANMKTYVGIVDFTPFKLTAILTSPQPQMKGYVYVSIRAAKASTTYYIDPQITLS